MTLKPEDIAASIAMEYHARRTWGYDPNQHQEYIGLIAAAIRAAQERGRVAGLEAAEAVATDMFEGQEFAMEGTGEPEFGQYEHGAVIANSIAAAIARLKEVQPIKE